MVRINGTESNISGKTVAHYLVENGYNINRVAVELNGDILPKSQYADTFLKNGDVIEIVSFVGGG